MAIHVAETIRKMMGWCPNASMIKVRKSVPFDDRIVNVPGNDGELTCTTAGWWNKYRNLALLTSICLTLLSIKWLISQKINVLDFLLALLFAGMLFGIMARLPGFDSLNKIASSRSDNTIKLSTKRMLAVYILDILSIIAFTYLWSIYGWERIPGYFIGFLLVSWSWYLQILYWEKKNRKTIVTHGYFKPTIVIINSGST